MQPSEFSFHEDFLQDIAERLRPLTEAVARGERSEVIVAFPPTLCAAERKIVHQTAKKAGLFSESSGVGADRFIKVSQPCSEQNAPAVALAQAPNSNALPQVPREERVSRTLSLILRHRAADLGLQVRSDGFVRMSELLRVQQLQNLEVTAAEVQALANSCGKQRFTITEEKSKESGRKELLVRANQGHTMKAVSDNALLTPVANASDLRTCVHGTYFQHWQSIRNDGLCDMGRNHIHFVSVDPGGEVKSGMRSDVQIAIYVDAIRAMKDGCEFYRSSNGVLLTRGFSGVIPASYFLKAVVLVGAFGHKVGSLLVLEAPTSCLQFDESDDEVVLLTGPIMYVAP